MKKLIGQIASFLKDENGATSIEYMFALALVIVVLVIVIATLGERITTMFTSTSNEWASI